MLFNYTCTIRKPASTCWTYEKQLKSCFLQFTPEAVHHTASLQHHKYCDEKDGPRYLWLTQSGFPKGHSGQVKRRLWWCHRKEEHGQLEKAQPNDRAGYTLTHTLTHTSPPPKAETDIHFLMVNNWVHLGVKHSVHATTYKAWIYLLKKDTLNLFHIFLLSGTNWLQVLSNHVGNVESLLSVRFLRRVFNAGTLLWLRP